MNKKRIIVIDDHPVFRFGLIKLINEEHDLEVCGDTDTPSSTMQLIESQNPSLAVIDITLNGRNSIDLLKQIHSCYPNILILMVSMHEEDLYSNRVYDAGAKGYVQKDKDPETIVTAIHYLLLGKQYWHEKVVDSFPSPTIDQNELSQLHNIKKLGDREYEIFHLIGKGLRPKEIAQQLSLSVHTVENHRSNIRQKLNLKNSKQLIRIAYEYAREQVS